MVANHCIWKRFVLPDGLVSHMRDGCNKPEKLSHLRTFTRFTSDGVDFPAGSSRVLGDHSW